MPTAYKVFLYGSTLSARDTRASGARVPNELDDALDERLEVNTASGSRRPGHSENELRNGPQPTGCSTGVTRGTASTEGVLGDTDCDKGAPYCAGAPEADMPVPRPNGDGWNVVQRGLLSPDSNMWADCWRSGAVELVCE